MDEDDGRTRARSPQGFPKLVRHIFWMSKSDVLVVADLVLHQFLRDLPSSDASALSEDDAPPDPLVRRTVLDGVIGLCYVTI